MRGLSVAAVLLTACSSPPPPPEPVAPEPPKPKPLYEWYGDGVSGSSRLKIDIDQQKIFVYRGDTEVGWTTMASGVRSKPTPTGSFKIQEKKVDKSSNLWGKIYDANGKVVVSDARNGRDTIPEGGKFVGAKMPYWMRLTGDGIGMHQGPIPRPGHRASHGCIRVHSGFIKRLYNEVSIGTPVTVVGDGPRWKPPVYKPAPKPKPEPQPEPAEVIARPEPAEVILPAVPQPVSLD